MKTPSKLSESSNNGCECYYFSNGDKTGWKTYNCLDVAKVAWASQIWAVRKDIAPLVLSGIKELKMDLPLKQEYCCPVSNMYIDLVDEIYVGAAYQYLDNRTKNSLKINCSDHLIRKGNSGVRYGFLTEEIDIIADKIFGLIDSQYSYFKEKTSLRIGDAHKGNWGILKNKIVFIDFGHQFSQSFGDKQVKEIDKIMEQA